MKIKKIEKEDHIGNAIVSPKTVDIVIVLRQTPQRTNLHFAKPLIKQQQHQN